MRRICIRRAVFFSVKFFVKKVVYFAHHVIIIINIQRSIYINWPNLTIWLSLLHEMLGNICIAIACYPDQRYTQFYFFRKKSGTFLHHILCIIFPEKCVKLYSINWANLIIWLPLHLEIFGNICIANVY